MAQLDRLLAVMVSNRAESLVLAENEPISIRKDGASHPLTKQVIGSVQLLGLVREIAPREVMRDIDAGTSSDFLYSAEDGSGPFRVRVDSEAGVWNASITRENGRNTRRPTPGRVAVVAGPGQVDDPVARTAIERLLRILVERGASDLHMRCSEPPIVRQHGEMMRLEGGPPFENAALERMLFSIMPARNREEFEATNDTDFAYEIDGVARFRCNGLRERKGAAAVFRVIPAKVVTVDDLSISTEVRNLCQLTKGLVLVTGPTGSGKSTTLCALIDLVNRTRTDHVVTIEDPIESVHQNKSCVITQRQVGLHTVSFKQALRAALREDPDIVLVGELRDLETASIAIETAETGHLVFATLHTTTASSTIDRLIDQFAADRQEQIRTMLSESLKGVISQVLCKKIGGGRVAAREILLSTPAVSNLIRESKTFQIPSVMQTSRKSGMTTLNDSLIELVDSRQVEAKEAYMKAADKTGFAAQLRARSHDTSFVDGDAVTAPTPQRGQETGLNVKTPMPRPGYGTGKR